MPALRSPSPAQSGDVHLAIVVAFAQPPRPTSDLMRIEARCIGQHGPSRLSAVSHENSVWSPDRLWRARRGAGAPAGRPGIGAHRQSRIPATYPVLRGRRRHRRRRRNRDAGALHRRAGAGGDPRDIEHDVAVYLFHRTTSGWAPVRPARRASPRRRSAASIPGSRCATALRRSRSIRSMSSSGATATGCPRPITGVDPCNARRLRHHRRRAHPLRRQQRPVDGHPLREEFRTESGARPRSWSATIAAATIEFTGGPVDISGGRAVVLSPYNEEEPPRRIAQCHRVSRLGSAGALPAPVGHPQLRRPRRSDSRSRYAAMRSSSPAPTASGTRVYRPAPSDAWEEFDKLQPLDSHMGGGVTTVIEKNHLFLMQRNWNAEREAYVINVFRKSASGPYEHVATLVVERRRIARQLRHQQPARHGELRQRGLLLRTADESSASPRPSSIRSREQRPRDGRRARAARSRSSGAA